MATRLTCFALLSAIEIDFRHYVELLASRTNRVDILPIDVRQNAKRRSEADGVALSADSDLDLLDYIDFADIAKTLNGFRIGALPAEGDALEALAKRFERLAPARNRVCHARPLEPGDFAGFYDFSTDLVNQNVIDCPETRKAIEMLANDPSFVVHLSIPNFWSVGTSRIRHNLPLPEFDDTGFLGRTTDRREVTKQLRCTHPVITITGEGGVGKTALALRCLYDFVESDEASVDIIVWITLKSRVLTAGGIRDIRDAINTTVGIVQNVTAGVGSPLRSEDLDALFSELREYMSTFRVIVAIDNYETIQVDNLRPLLSSVPPGSKVFFTSRLGLGEYEVRYKLDPLDIRTAVSLGRRYAQFLNAGFLVSLPDNQWEQLCESLFKNALLIKWAVSSIAGGATLEHFIARQHETLKTALQFCFENLFLRLSPVEKSLIWVLASARRPLSGAELHFIARQQQTISQAEIDLAIGYLHNSSMLKRSFAREPGVEERRTEYALTDFAAEYVAKCAPPPTTIFSGVQESLKKLREMAELVALKEHAGSFSPRIIHAHTTDQRIAAVFLNQALEFQAMGDTDGARSQVAEAKILAPTFGETYRIAAGIEVEDGNYYAATQEFEAGIEVDSGSPYLRFAYALILQQQLDDAAGALAQIDEALKADRERPILLWTKAQSLTWLGRYEEAADIFEKLLSNINSETARTRILYRDQTAECYRRWAERDLAIPHNTAVLNHLHRALQILEQAFLADEFDTRMVNRYFEVAELALKYSNASNVSELAVKTGKRLEGMRKYIWGGKFPWVKRDWFLQRFSYSNEVSELFLKLEADGLIAFADAEKETRDSKGRLEGVVYRLPAGVNYGFIRDVNQTTWFFHKTALADGSLWSKIRVGTLVSFLARVEGGKKSAQDVRIHQASSAAG